MTNFHELPESMECVELRKCFIDFLIQYCNSTNDRNVYNILSELIELSDRQWHTYEMLDTEIKEQLTKYLKTILDFEDEEIMDCVLCIIPRLGLGDVFKYILENKSHIQNLEVLKNIDEAIDEYGQDVEYPYSGM